MKQLSGRTAVVTGSASGIGLAIVEAFLAESMNVVMADLNAPLLETEARRLADRGNVLPVVVDVRDPDAVEKLAATSVDHFGALHVAVNNAGTVTRAPAWELSLEDWRLVIDVNLWGVVHGIRSFVPRILESDEGHIVNTASLAAVLTRSPGIAHYTAAKHAVLGLSDTLRNDLAAIGAPIGVSTLMPGLTLTPLNPVGTVLPATVAANVMDGIKRNRPYVYSDLYYRDEIEARLNALRDARNDVL